VGRLLLFFLIFPFYVMGQDKQGPTYRVTIADSSYGTLYTKTHLSGFVQAIIKNGKQEELKIKINMVCDTVPNTAYYHDPTMADSFKYIINCTDHISFADTLAARNIMGFEKLINEEIFIFKDSLKIIPATIDMYLIDENSNTMGLDNKTFDKDRIREFFHEKNGNIYVRILRLEFNESDSTNMIEVQIGFRLEK
jgi:hypothetical protein